MCFPSSFHAFRSAVRKFAFRLLAIYGSSFWSRSLLQFPEWSPADQACALSCMGPVGFPECDPASEATIPLRRRILAGVREGHQ